MKQYSILLCAGTALACAALVLGQTTITTYQPDLNGRRVVVSTSSVAADGQQTREVMQTINGRSTPREQISERVVSSDGKSKVTERMIRRLDPSGGLSQTERIVIEETLGAGGNKTVQETIYRGTLNGPLQEAQRTTSETRVAGDVTTTEIVQERPAVNRSFEATERREVVTMGTALNRQTTETVLRPSPSGRFVVSQRKEISLTTQGGETKIATAVYEPQAASDPVLISQSVETATKTSDGAQVTEIDLYVVGLADARPALTEHKTVVLRTGADGSVTETTSVRMPVSTDAGRLGAAHVISETVCQGKCAPEKPAAEAKPAAK